MKNNNWMHTDAMDGHHPRGVGGRSIGLLRGISEGEMTAGKQWLIPDFNVKCSRVIITFVAAFGSSTARQQWIKMGIR